MISRLKPYPRVRDAGVEWIGYVPTHWELVPNRSIFEEIKERDRPGEPLLSVTIKQGVIRQKDLLEDSSKKDSSNVDKMGYKVVLPGDIAYNKMRAWQGAFGVSDHQGIVSPAYVVERLRKKANPRYFHHLMRTPGFAKEAERWSYGITSDMWSLRPEHFRLIYACVPSLSEQNVIVRFLDRVDQFIQEYIRAKQKLIMLLQQQKQAIVDQGVTGQIDVRTGRPHSDYKASGVEWLGDVPQHWELRRLKFLVGVPSGQVDPRLEDNRHKVLIAPNHIAPGGGAITRFETAAEQGAESGKFQVHAGDVVYSKIRPILQKVAISPFDGLCSADMYPIRVRGNEICADFVLYLLLSSGVTKYTVDCSMRVAMPKVNREALGNCWVCYPRLPEQKGIVRWIQKERQNCNLLIERTRRQMTLIQEFGERIIADVVTGKLDVRDV